MRLLAARNLASDFILCTGVAVILSACGTSLHVYGGANATGTDTLASSTTTPAPTSAAPSDPVIPTTPAAYNPKPGAETEIAGVIGPPAALDGFNIITSDPEFCTNNGCMPCTSADCAPGTGSGGTGTGSGTGTGGTGNVAGSGGPGGITGPASSSGGTAPNKGTPGAGTGGGSSSPGPTLPKGVSPGSPTDSGGPPDVITCLDSSSKSCTLGGNK